MLGYYLLAGAFGAIVGFAELASRYRDAPGRAIMSPSALLYVAINVVASVGALALIDTFDWTFGVDEADQELVQTLVAGFSAMAFFRSSLFTARIGDTDVGIGPSIVLQGVIAMADRGVDRNRAGGRARDVSRIMEGISFELAAEALPTYCFALMQNVGEEEQKAAGEQVKGLHESTTMNPRAKALSLGLALMNIVGVGVLEVAVENLRGEIGEPKGE
jgi:hypothetical protein